MKGLWTELSIFYNPCTWSYAVGTDIASSSGEEPSSIKHFWSLNPLFQGDRGTWDRTQRAWALQHRGGSQVLAVSSTGLSEALGLPKQSFLKTGATNQPRGQGAT